GGFTAGSTTTVTVSGGIATFSNLVLDTAGNYTTRATAVGGISGPPSSSFTIGALGTDHLGFSVQPDSSMAGQAISPSVQVQVLDKYGNLLTADNSDQVSRATGNHPGGGSLDGTTTVTVSGGVATFSDLAVHVVGTGYTLKATFTGLPVVTSSTFTITPGAPYQLAFSIQPGDTVAGSAIRPAVQVQVL